MLFLCAGAFETLYDQVFQRVTSPKSGIKLPTTTVYENGKIQIREYFTLRHHFRQEDLFDYGMQPQFLSRFDNAVILEDLNAGTLARIFRDPEEACSALPELLPQVRHRARDHRRGGAEDRRGGSRSSRIGARALKSVYGRIIKPFEFDPFSRQEVKANGGAHRLVIDEPLVTGAMRPTA